MPESLHPPAPARNHLWHRYLRFWRSDPAADLDDELAFHFQSCVDDAVAAGMTVEQARADAARRLGDVKRVRAVCLAIEAQYARSRTMADMLHGVASDLRVALRQLRANPALTVAAVLCLTLGIGANTAIFSVVDAVLLRPLPFPDADRLVLVGEGLPMVSEKNFGTISTPDFLDYTALDSSVFASSAIFQSRSAALTGDAAPERVAGIEASASLLSVLGVTPALGRAFQPGDDAEGSADVVMLTDALWRRRFGADPAIVGRTIHLDGAPATVIGVMPRDFVFPLPGLDVEPAEFLVPLRMTSAVLQTRGNSYNTLMIARLAAGVSRERAAAAVNTIAARLPSLHPDAYSAHARVVATAVPLRERLVSDVRRTLLILMGAVACVLLVACINVSGLLLARAAARSREIAVRAALGATRARLVQQFLAESALLVALGTVGGLLVAHWGTHALATLAPAGSFAGYRVGLDPRVFVLTLGISAIAAVGFSLVPALQHGSAGLPARLREEGRSASAGRGRQRARRLLVVSEIALALVLATGAGLLLRSFLKTLRVDPGFTPEHVLLFQAVLPRVRYPDAAGVLRAEQSLVERLGAIPGVRDAGAAVHPPMLGSWQIAVTPEGVQLDKVPLVVNDMVLPGYFKAMGIRLLEGRTFSARDTSSTQPVAVVDEQFAQRYFPGGSAVGRRLKWGSATSPAPWITIVGVVRAVKAKSLDEQAIPETYFPALGSAANPDLVDAMLRGMTYVVRTTGDPLALTTSVRNVVHAMDPELPLSHVESGEMLVSQSMNNRRFTTLLFGAFAVLALVLAATGIYGLIAYSVTQRQREIGVRMAIGATEARVVRLILREGAWTAALGTALGVLGAVALTRVMRSLLFGVGALDLVTFAAAPALLIVVALFSSWLPARRAARVDPSASMR